MKTILTLLLLALGLSASAQNMFSDGYVVVNKDGQETKIDTKVGAVFHDEGLTVYEGDSVTAYTVTDKSSVGKAILYGIEFNLFQFELNGKEVTVAVTNAKNGIVTVIDDGVVSKVYYFKQSKIEQI
ncbi:MAG: hypothetical protein ACRDE7_06725 [Sphingobacterium sp.]